MAQQSNIPALPCENVESAMELFRSIPPTIEDTKPMIINTDAITAVSAGFRRHHFSEFTKKFDRLAEIGRPSR